MSTVHRSTRCVARATLAAVTLAAALAAAFAATGGTLGAQAPGAAASGPLGRLRMGSVVRPDTVTVGDPFIVQVRVQAPANARVAFAPGPDSAAAVEALSTVRVERAPSGDNVDHVATYRVAAWDVGAQPLRIGDAVVTLDGAERRVALGELQVFVRSVLPADTTLHVPKPARPPLADLGPWWLRWLPWLLAALALLGLLFWWYRRRRRPKPAPAPGERAYEDAIAAFDRLEKMRLVEAGERGRYVALAVEILRDYFAARVPGAVPSLTTTELLPAVRDRGEVPLPRLATLLGGADLVKFAAAPVSGADARRAGAEARSIVEDVERVLQERAAAAARIAAERAREDAESKRRYEEERRRAQRRNAA